MLDRRVGVDDQLDVVDVDATGGDVGGDQHGGPPCGERGQVPHAGGLGEVAVHLHGGHARAVQLAGQRLRTVLRPGEHDGPRRARHQLDEHAEAIRGGDVEDVVVHRLDRRAGRVDAVRHRIGEEALHQHVHAVVERGREQQALAVGGRRVEDARHAGQEAEVGHVVGLVQHGDLDRVEAHVPLAHVVLEASGAGDDHVDATAEPVDLTDLGDAAEHGEDPEAERFRERERGVADLVHQLTRGGEDQRPRVAGPALGGRGGEASEHRQQEGERLAGPGAPPAQHVAPRDGVGERRGLDRERTGDALGLEDLHHAVVHSEVGERRHLHLDAVVGAGGLDPLGGPARIAGRPGT